MHSSTAQMQHSFKEVIDLTQRTSEVGTLVNDWHVSDKSSLSD
jgi:hypothetical protein